MTAIARLLFIAMALAGCARSPTIQWHALSEPTPNAVTPADQVPLRVVIASTTVPPSIDRPQLVVNAGEGAISILDTERWAEPLRRSIPRTLGDYLARELGNALVWSTLASAPARPDIRISIEIARWRSVRGHAATMEMLWTLRDARQEKSGRTVVEVAVHGDDYASLVAAHREALRIAAAALAQDVRSFTPAQP